jgi:hypothetical protein
MDYSIFGIVLGGVLLVMAVHIASPIIYSAPAPTKAA